MDAGIEGEEAHDLIEVEGSGNEKVQDAGKRWKVWKVRVLAGSPSSNLE